MRSISLREDIVVMTVGTAQPLKPIDPKDLQRAEETVALRAELDDYIAGLVEGGLTSVYFVGAGGSLICSFPAHYLLSRKSGIPTFQLQSDEFNCVQPALMGPGSLVVLASYTGTTKETVAAAKTAKGTGATVVTAAKEGTPLAAEADRNFAAKSDIFELMVAYSILKATGVVEDRAEVDAMLAALPTALRSAAEQADDKLAHVADKFKDDEITYVLGSGPNQAWAYGLAMCYLQEMQWKHAAGFNAGEFFQGAFEVVDDSSAVILWLAEDASRPMAERARKFLDTYAARAEYIDTKDLELSGIPDSLRPDVSPLVVAALASRLAQHYEAVRGHDLEQRRYMFKVEY
jgi:fructoselysine-6-P-deglycase FrlB-like protein